MYSKVGWPIEPYLIPGRRNELQVKLFPQLGNKAPSSVGPEGWNRLSEPTSGHAGENSGVRWVNDSQWGAGSVRPRVLDCTIIFKGTLASNAVPRLGLSDPGNVLAWSFERASKDIENLINNDRDPGCRQLHRNVISNDEATFLVETRQTKGITRRKPAFGWLALCDWLVQRPGWRLNSLTTHNNGERKQV